MNKELVEQQVEHLMKNGGKVVDQVNRQGHVVTKGTASGLPYKTAKQIVRQKLHTQNNYVAGKLGASKVAGKASRRERRKQGNFTPKYNGVAPRTFEEMYGVGLERFNSKFVTIKETEE